MLGTLWNTLLIQPITISLSWLFSLTGSLGLAIIILTVVLQLILTPLRLPSLKSAKKMRDIKPKLDDLKEKHKEDKMALAQAQMDLYKEHGINPFGGLLPTLLSLPIIFALYRVLLDTLQHTEGITTTFYWLDLTKPDPYYVIPVLVAISQFLLAQFSTPPTAQSAKKEATNDQKKKPGDDTEAIMNAFQSQMKYIFPVMIGIFSANLPAGVGLYWLTSVVFAIIQHQVTERLH